jgi:hypothetical protein
MFVLPLVSAQYTRHAGVPLLWPPLMSFSPSAAEAASTGDLASTRCSGWLMGERKSNTRN